MPETPTTREELRAFIRGKVPSLSPFGVDHILDALSAAGLAVVPLDAPPGTADGEDYRAMIAAADLLRGGR